MITEKLISVHLSEKDFGRLQNLIKTQCGINMTPGKKTMIQARLQKRLRSTGIDTISEYCNYLFSHEGMKKELVHMIDAITTNKTDFFRESAHFDILTERILPEITQSRQWSVYKPLQVWSAGCATGEEAYTLAMILNKHAMNHKGLKFTVLATDISTKALEEAKLGIYHSDKIESVPAEMKKKYLLQSRDRKKRLVRIIPELRKHVQFERLNLIEDGYRTGGHMNIIFLRNVLIYFDRMMHEKILNSISLHLTHGGYVFVGHAETLHGLNVPYTQVFPTVYKKIMSHN